MPETPAMRGKAWHQPAPPVEALRVPGVIGYCLSAGIAGGLARKFLIEPDAIEKFHQREVEDIDPYYRLGAVIAVVVPGTVGGEDQIAAGGLATLALDRRVAAAVGQDRAAGVRGVDMNRGDIARVIDRHRATHGRGDLQPTAEPRIGQ